MNPCVIIPSIRQPNLDYLEPLGSTPIVVIDDSNGNIPKNLAPHITVLDYADRRTLMGQAEWLIPEKNPACKNLGLYWAWKEGFDTLILLDDDCDCRVSPDFLEQIPIGKVVERTTIETDSPWINPLRCLGENEVWARGYPYEYRHFEEHWDYSIDCYPLFNEGLWTGTADINGIDKLAGTPATRGRQLVNQALVPSGKMLPLSIMNVQFHRDLVPAFYQPPDYTLPGGHRIRRHDDVWSMMFLKHLMDITGHDVTVGGPLVWHRKEGDMNQEILSEHGANLIQSHLLNTIATASAKIEDNDDLEYAELAHAVGLSMQTTQAPGCFAEIIKDYGSRVVAWAALFE